MFVFSHQVPPSQIHVEHCTSPPQTIRTAFRGIDLRTGNASTTAVVHGLCSVLIRQMTYAVLNGLVEMTTVAQYLALR